MSLHRGRGLGSYLKGEGVTSTPLTPESPVLFPNRGGDLMADITIPRGFLYLLAEFGNILPWNGESSGNGSDGIMIQWYAPKGDGSGWEEVCFLDFRDGVVTVGFNGDCIDKYRVQYFALSGLAKRHDAEWCDFDEPKVANQEDE